METIKNLNSQSQGKKILIIEDEAVLAYDMSTKLQRLGHTVVGITAQYQEVDEILSKEQVDLVLLDIYLNKEYDGIDIACFIKIKYPTNIIFLTAYAQDSYLKRAKRVSPRGYILKPYKIEEINANIAMLDNEPVFHGDLLSMEKILKDIGLKMKQGRKNQKLTQVEAAEILKVNYRHYQKLEAGLVNMKFDSVLKIARKFNIDVSQLIFN
jgi:CheY-like chemotaxis protein